MTFIHNDDDFQQLIGIVAQKTGIVAALVEKDYWVTHTLWALHETGLDLWFKGGTSLSKGFGLIQRFSEDLDLMIEPGSVLELPSVTSWTSTNKGPVKRRRAFYDALVNVLAVPDVTVEVDHHRVDKHARSADYLAYYPGALTAELPSAMSPFVRLEVGRARVVPYVERPLSSFVHDYLASQGMADDFVDNRPAGVRCVHPLVTLFEKLDAMSRRYARENIEADRFIRHYEDIARIIRAIDELPALSMTPVELANDMLASNDLAEVPTADAPPLLLDDANKRAAVERAYAQIEPMFWGERISLGESCEVTREWLGAVSQHSS